jgi:ABC-type branched-subunit amino acid transport system ATPase component
MTPLLACSNLTCRFGGVVALDRVDFTVGEGEIVGLIGPNGSGKTTLFNVVTGIYRADAGAITFAGLDLVRASPQAVYRAGIARTFQRSRMCLPLSVFDNIMVGNHKRLNHGLVFNLIRRDAFAGEFRRSFDEARELVEIFSPPLAARIEEPAAGLPMIDRRRIEICRALISRPRLLLLDEPSAGMTHEETRELMDDIMIVRERMAGLTIVIIEHEMGVIERITSRCAVLNYGRKISEGTFGEVARDPQVQEAYLGVAAPDVLTASPDATSPEAISPEAT